MELFYEIQLENGNRLKASAEESLALQVNDVCIFRKDFYIDSGRIIRTGVPPPQETPALPPKTGSVSSARKNEIPRIQRKALETDLARVRDNKGREDYALKTAARHIEQLQLPMKLINAHYSCDGKLVTIQFSADGRVDFRELVKQLSTALNTRIELHQIGVRDETAAVGGVAPCGRVLCCCSFLKDFASINVRMAKDQDLSLTPSTISGVCGRLKCCLKYEHEGYLELEKNMLRRGEVCESPEGRCRVVDRNLLTGKHTVQLEESGRTAVFQREELKELPAERRRPRMDNPGPDHQSQNPGPAHSTRKKS